MPNWCDNSLKISHPDVTKVDAVNDCLIGNTKGLFETLRPNPKGEWEYDWSVTNWGTKWDAGVHDYDRVDTNEIWISFDTAWSPPTALYDYLVQEGWTVEALYHEPGMCYAGIYDTDAGDMYYEYDITDKDSIDNLPNDIVEFAGLEDAHNDWLIDNLHEQWADAERSEWVDGTVKPVRDGWYEIQTEGWPYTQFKEFKNGEWEYCYNTISMWRGLAEEAKEM